MKEFLKSIPGLRKTVRRLKGLPALTPREYLLDRMPVASVCAEIGVHEGEFSRRIMQRVRPRRLHLIDPWKHEESKTYLHALYGGMGEEGQQVMDRRCEAVKAQFREEIDRGRVILHRKYSDEAAGEFADEYFDWIYIDANHQYDFVKRDLELYYPKVKAGGFITGDDYGFQGWWQNGVQKAVDELVAEKPDLTLTVRHHQFLVRKPE